MACVYALGILSSYGYNRIMVNISQGTMRNLRDDLFTHMESLPIQYFDTHAHGDIMSVYTNDVDTLRQVISANDNLWGAVMMAGDQWLVEEPRSIPVLDRIGGGDGFVGGMLYGLLKGWEPAKCLQFGWATGALAVTMLTDFGTPVDEGQVWDIYAGNARVKR